MWGSDSSHRSSRPTIIVSAGARRQMGEARPEVGVVFLPGPFRVQRRESPVLSPGEEIVQIDWHFLISRDGREAMETNPAVEFRGSN